MATNNQQKESISENDSTFSLERACKSHNMIKNLCEIIETHQDPSARNLGMSIIHLLKGNHDKTLSCLEYLVKNHPDVSLIYRRIAEIYISRDDLETAAENLEEALKLNNHDLTATFWLGLIYYELGNKKKAKICLNVLKDDVFFLHAANSTWL